MHPWLAVEDIVDAKLDLRTTQPRMLDRDLGHVARVRKQPQIEGGERREAKIVAGLGVDRRSAAQIANQPRAQPVVEVPRLRLDLVAGRAAALSRSVPVKIIEVEAGGDGHLVGEREGVGKREG